MRLKAGLESVKRRGPKISHIKATPLEQVLKVTSLQDSTH